MQFIPVSRRGLVLVTAILLTIILSGFAAADCCVYDRKCTSDLTGCPPDNIFGGSCGDLADCKMGCCCQESKAMRKVECSGSEFNIDSQLTSGASCSCDETYTVSGMVKKAGFGLGGASVSVGSLTTTSSSSGDFGSFSLSGVPGGKVVVFASKDGCTGNFTISDLQSDRSGIEVNIVCACTPGCDAANKSYCDSDRAKHVFDVSNPAQRSEYCMYCADMDEPVCGAYSDCRAGDGACPLGCSASPSDEKYDPDCSCNIDSKNGYCPPGCDSSTDADCGVVFKPACGDGFVSYPFETCEKDPAEGQVSFCSAEACTDCNCVSDEKCGNGRIDAGEQCELGNICVDGSVCMDCRCSEKCSGSATNPTISAGFDKDTKQVKVSWSLSSACDSLVSSYILMECVKDSSNPCTDVATFSESGRFYRGENEAILLVSENTQYSFFVKALFVDDRLGFSRIASIKTGSDFCMNRGPADPEEFCIDNKRSMCDSNNNIKVVEDCTRQDLYCSGPDRNGKTVCELVDACSLCNGLYGMFGIYLNLKVNTGDDLAFCDPASQGETVSGCYVDKTTSLFPAYKACGYVTSCYDFKSKEACTGADDPCSFNKECEWVPLPSNPAFGGICRPKNEQMEDCSLCDDPEYNWLGPICTPEVCSLFGTCFYQGVDNTPTCSSRAVHYCLEYDTQDRCLGFGANKASVEVDVLYGENNTRIGGTHAVTRSGDELGLGKCYWEPWEDGTGKCRRDADGLPVDTKASVGFDCERRDFFCESDFTDPVTSLLPSASGLYPASPKIRYSVSDNYPSDKISTFFCVSQVGSPACYPDEPGVLSGVDRYFMADKLSESGRYNLYYYSADPAKNLELIKSTLIRVDADAPFIELISPRNESEFGTNQPTISVLGRTASDVSYLCANNTALKKATCINSCSKRGVSPPCISADGMFNLTVPILASNQQSSLSSSNIVRSIVFYAEDFAGNVYSNTMLGVLYDVKPPEAPTIVIR
ncbi:hypothetical protein JW826_03310 [Candidatus Woesearchaeota archaeon]|nr:hypothetical protein [Candidatus Woesearchaeota archaeon]